MQVVGLRRFNVLPRLVQGVDRHPGDPVRSAITARLTAWAATWALFSTAFATLARTPRITPSLRPADCVCQGCNIAIIQLNKSTALEATRQHHCPVADADQAAHGMADRLEHPAHLAVAAF